MPIFVNNYQLTLLTKQEYIYENPNAKTFSLTTLAEQATQQISLREARQL